MKKTGTEILEAVKASGVVVEKSVKTAANAVKVVKESVESVAANAAVNKAIKDSQKDGTVTSDEEAVIADKKAKAEKEKADIKVAIDKTKAAADEVKDAAVKAAPELKEAGVAIANSTKSGWSKLKSFFSKK